MSRRSRRHPSFANPTPEPQEPTMTTDLAAELNQAGALVHVPPSPNLEAETVTSKVAMDLRDLKSLVREWIDFDLSSIGDAESKQRVLDATRSQAVNAMNYFRTMVERCDELGPEAHRLREELLRMRTSLAQMMNRIGLSIPDAEALDAEVSQLITDVELTGRAASASFEETRLRLGAIDAGIGALRTVVRTMPAGIVSAKAQALLDAHGAMQAAAVELLGAIRADRRAA
jgi:hypothetical protein